MVAIFNGLQRPQKGRTELDLPAGTRAEIDAVAERDRQIERLEKRIRRSARRSRKPWLESGKSKLPPDAVQAFLPTPRS